MSNEIKSNPNLKVGPIDVVKQMWFYIGFSLLLTLPGLYAMFLSVTHYPTHAPLLLGIDFTGGTMLQYGFFNPVSQETDVPKMRLILEEAGAASPIIQLQLPETGMKAKGESISTELKTEKASPKSSSEPVKPGQSVTDMFKDAAAAQQASAQAPSEKQIQSVVSIRTQDLTTEQTVAMQKALKSSFGDFVLMQKNRVGPTLAQELFIKAAWGLLLAYAMIVGYLAFRFQLDYAVMAIVALLHDTVFMIGAFSWLGWYHHIEVDSMFVTAILTAVGFSVHDTIVVFDRIRENYKTLFTQKLSFDTIVNVSVNQTIARSINTSLTALLTLTALYFFGGESTRNFVLAMILGIVVGTYSSIFVASSLLAWWRRRGQKKTLASSSPSPQQPVSV